ncbi:MAG: carboxypeptidase-like regulatory domain-containing protein [Pyrinomonadaceae bacterium]
MKKSLRQVNKLVFSIFLTVLFLNTIQAQIFTGAGFTIVDNGGRVPASCSTVAVSGVSTSVNVRSVSLTGTHSWLGDIEARVYPPAAAPPPSTVGTTVITSPPDGRACNLSGTYRFTDMALPATNSIDAATVGCADATNVASGDYRTSTYGGGTAVGPVTSLATSFGALTPAQANGNWLVCVFDFAAPDGGAITSTSVQLTVLSSASVAVGGRVTTAKGSGIGKVKVTMTDPSGTVRMAITNPFGYYRFEGVEVGANYIITASGKGYTFDNPTVVHFASEDFDGINFTANP